jgi:hypothetical protein
MGGLQDNSTIIFTDSPAWRRIIGGDGSWTAMDPNNPLVNYGSYQYSNIFKTVNGEDYQYMDIPSNGSASLFIAPFVLAPSNPDILYVGRSKIFKTEDGGANWEATNANNTLNGQAAFSMDVSTTNADVLYLSTADLSNKPGVFRTVNGGETYQEITGNLPDRFYNDITVDPNDEGIVYLCAGGFGSGHVFKSEDYGENWQDISNGLPDVPTSALVVDPSNSNYLYVGNDLGVFYSANGGQDWQVYMDGIMDVTLVMDLKIDAKERELYVATHGNGSYIRDLVQPISSTNEVAISPIRFFPNPAKDIVNIQNLPEGSGEIQLYDLQGKSMLKRSFEGQNQLSIDISGFSVGTYFYQVLIQNERIGTGKWQKVD